MGTSYHNQLFRGHTRPGWAGQVKISDNLPVFGARADVTPRQVSGIIVPVDTSSRPSKTPTPFNGFQTGKVMGTDNGHLMALELGGPDISDNIAPQSNLWQQSGGWRKVERLALAQALEWMGMQNKYAPNGPFDMPQVGAYFRVAPSFELDPTNGEPRYYDGIINRIVLWKNPAHGLPLGAEPEAGWRATETSGSQRIFRIAPGKVWWNNEDISDVSI